MTVISYVNGIRTGATPDGKLLHAACCIVAQLLAALLHVACFGSLICHQAARVRKLTDDCLFGLGPNKYADSRARPLTAWQQILLPLQARASASPRGDFDLLYASCLTFHNR